MIGPVRARLLEITLTCKCWRAPAPSPSVMPLREMFCSPDPCGIVSVPGANGLGVITSKVGKSFTGFTVTLMSRVMIRLSKESGWTTRS